MLKIYANAFVTWRQIQAIEFQLERAYYILVDFELQIAFGFAKSLA